MNKEIRNEIRKILKERKKQEAIKEFNKYQKVCKEIFKELIK